MKTLIEERDGEIVIFLTPESADEIAQLLRVSASMKSPNTGYCGFWSNHISGWISVPKTSRHEYKIISGSNR
jgi:hypothetical protein